VSTDLFEELGTDILLARQFLGGEKLETALSHFDQVQFTRIPIERAPEHVQKYFESLPGPEIHWVERDTEVDRLLYSEIKGVIAHLSERYRGIGISGDEGYRFNRYSEGQGYKLHVDRSNLSRVNVVRYVSVILNLNSEYEGGEIQFPRQSLTLNLGQGDLLIFPSCYTHPHAVLPLKRGIRKSMVSWLT
jgi:prolyl 4-hydroxylase